MIKKCWGCRFFIPENEHCKLSIDKNDDIQNVDEPTNNCGGRAYVPNEEQMIKEIYNKLIINEEPPVSMNKTKIGQIHVDSGQIILCDPIHAKNPDIIVSDFGGDGTFEVFMQKYKNGKRLIIEFGDNDNETI